MQRLTSNRRPPLHSWAEPCIQDTTVAGPETAPVAVEPQERTAISASCRSRMLSLVPDKPATPENLPSTSLPLTYTVDHCMLGG